MFLAIRGHCVQKSFGQEAHNGLFTREGMGTTCKVLKQSFIAYAGFFASKHGFGSTDGSVLPIPQHQSRAVWSRRFLAKMGICLSGMFMHFVISTPSEATYVLSCSLKSNLAKSGALEHYLNKNHLITPLKKNGPEAGQYLYVP